MKTKCGLESNPVRRSSFSDASRFHANEASAVDHAILLKLTLL